MIFSEKEPSSIESTRGVGRSQLFGDQHNETPRNRCWAPRGVVEEWTAGKYALEVAKQSGFITLAFGPTCQGESGAPPLRYLEDPYQRASDVRIAVTYLSTLEMVDANNIDALGICASGGHVLFAAQTDKRIKAVGTARAVDLGTLNAEGFGLWWSGCTYVEQAVGGSWSSANHRSRHERRIIVIVREYNGLYGPNGPGMSKTKAIRNDQSYGIGQKPIPKDGRDASLRMR
ncbi:uncharacterized protein NECHADRAFT_87956 [Fusarium vanettenii 77-13-4]|uniref:Dienelactone hydrolase domain-containing protein n=1 Tax=Fusarium vanettenii (strain ATCC MYA-4622 / CBS 123669 / FGSC 9596 / NRRL 45880 / 77-13-4) TaxID=660122 RepID=C7ZJW3_FUSV7|nr:uncharacterized protein NECHADRAFT_87956 [Fusarium vanettenii 77-13-4]EEU35662.1 hypothetical protein NECHADRAFT_87956 [Fusarium vanettenii 77-13-4]